MKTIIFLKIILLGIFGLFLTSCNNSDNSDDKAEQLAILKVTQEDGVSSFITPNICPILDVTNPLTADEIEFIYAIREDEKLAKDLYTAFAALYPTDVQFSRIAGADVTHIAAIETIFDYYEISYPTLGSEGVFADEERQAKYNDLLAKSLTVQGAFEAMVMLEEDNVAAYKAVEENLVNVNLKFIVFNMIKASSNHLKVAVRQLTAFGVTYSPVVLNQTDFNAIINSPFTQGNKYWQQMGKGNRGGNTNSQKGNMNQGNQGNVNGIGICTTTSAGSAPGTNVGQGQIGKGYRGGR